MRKLIFFLAFIFCFSSPAAADESSIYLCRTENAPLGDYVLRMKTYFEPLENVEKGKVDRLFNTEIVESTATQILRVPLLDQDSYVQAWFTKDLILDAQLSYDQGSRPFHATYKRNSERLELICQEVFTAH